MLEWYFRGFCDELSPWLRYIQPLPHKPSYYTAKRVQDLTGLADQGKRRTHLRGYRKSGEDSGEDPQGEEPAAFV